MYSYRDRTLVESRHVGAVLRVYTYQLARALVAEHAAEGGRHTDRARNVGTETHQRGSSPDLHVQIIHSLLPENYN